MDRLWTIREAARELGTSEATIRGLVRAYGMSAKRVPRNGNAFGLDSADMRVLRRALGQEPVSVAS